MVTCLRDSLKEAYWEFYATLYFCSLIWFSVLEAGHLLSTHVDQDQSQLVSYLLDNLFSTMNIAKAKVNGTVDKSLLSQ